LGEQAVRKAGLDDATSSWLKFTDPKKKSIFKKYFMEDGKISSTKIDTWLNSGAKDKGRVGAEALAEFLGTARKVVDEGEASFRSAPVGEYDHKSLTDLVNKTAKQTQETREAAAISAEIKYRESGGMGIPNSGPVGAITQHAGLAGKAMGALGVGYGVLHPLAGAAMVAGKALETASSVPRTVATLAALERVAQKVDKAIESGVATLVRGGVKASYVGRGEVAAGLSRMATNTDPKEFEKTAKRLTELSQNPELIHDTLNKSTADLYEHAPDTAGAANMAQAVAIHYLASKLPHHAKAGPLSKPMKYTPLEIGRFNRHKEAVHNPLSIIKKAAAGTLMPEHVEAVKTVYPALFGKIQSSVMGGLPKDPSKVPYPSRRGISLILGVPADGSFLPQSVQANQAVYAAKQAPPTPNKAANLTVSNRMLTPQQSAAQRGATDSA
jgi:hypothetical protein